MRRFFKFIMALVVFTLVSSCEKMGNKTAKYTVRMELSNAQQNYSVHYKLVLYEYNDAGETIANNTFDPAFKGTSQTFTASPNSVKVKVHIIPYKVKDVGGVVQRVWVKQVFYLEMGGEISIVIDDNFPGSIDEP